MSFTDRRFRLGDWVVDVDGCKIERDGAVKRLEPRVMATLAYLASMSDNCVSREELRLNVWKGAHVVDHAILRCISKLRDALEDDAANPRYIQTVPRRGYVIASENITPVASEKAQAAAFPPRTYASLGVGLTALILAAGAAFVLLSTRSPTESLEASVGSKETPVVGTLEQEREAAERFLLRGEFADAQKKIRDIQEQEPLDPYATAALARIAFYQGKTGGSDEPLLRFCCARGRRSGVCDDHGRGGFAARSAGKGAARLESSAGQFCGSGALRAIKAR